MTASPPEMVQPKQSEWYHQWSRYEAPEEFLFRDWIAPRTLEDFRGKHVMDAGCGPGHHVRLVAPVAKHVTGVDLNTVEIASSKLAHLDNVTIIEGDIATHQPAVPYDAIYCVGVIHHTDDPDRTFANLRAICREGGLLIVWCYSKEGNELVWQVVEPLRKLILRRLNRHLVEWLSWIVTALLVPFVYTVYLLPLPGLPFYDYFQNFRKLSFKRNMLNVFDKLNAPQTDFISRERIGRWFNADDFADVSITPYQGVSWRGSGIVRRKG
ncbi:MAG: class I SAM-dependent methyltransferase [Anaerolineae bacterium]|nr:class I SAM-dependent methyltransferase [Anaerolineae bacterium]